MRKLVIGLSTALIVLSLLIYYGFAWLKAMHETETIQLGDFNELHAYAGTNTWWIPEFMPPTAHEIYEKHNTDHNTGILALGFEPSTFTVSTNAFAEINQSEWSSIAPSWIVWRGKQFPKRLVAGEFDRLAPAGFQIVSQVRSPSNGPPARWYAAINSSQGIMYAWHE